MFRADHFSPLRGGAAVVECRLTDEFELDHTFEAGDRPHEQMGVHNG